MVHFFLGYQVPEAGNFWLVEVSISDFTIEVEFLLMVWVDELLQAFSHERVGLLLRIDSTRLLRLEILLV